MVNKELKKIVKDVKKGKVKDISDKELDKIEKELADRWIETDY